ncbi:hypothetical protein LWM68_34810 [Niabella sp. W65]|nr:hypothetical protein [Niabella sp. W65]MCH7367478.1 hypothetical protein [Niabella sp. W65]ULT43580.1 hypothetical protein KRR40_09205 [Niabella sp. I65]
MKQLFSMAVAAVLALPVTAQNGKENISNLCGCFEVTFKYAETFSPDKDYKFHDREKYRAPPNWHYLLSIPIKE